jgi:hypothetical protein
MAFSTLLRPISSSVATRRTTSGLARSLSSKVAGPVAANEPPVPLPLPPDCDVLTAT